MIAFLTMAAAPFLFGEPQREISSYLGCLLANGMSKIDKLADVDRRIEMLTIAKAHCVSQRQQAIANVQREGSVIGETVGHDKAAALATGIDRAVERWAQAGPNLGSDTAMEILNEETLRAYNQ